MKIKLENFVQILVWSVILSVKCMECAPPVTATKFWFSSGNLPVIGSFSSKSNNSFDHDGVHYGVQIRSKFANGTHSRFCLSTGNRLVDKIRTGFAADYHSNIDGFKNSSYFSKFGFGKFGDEKATVSTTYPATDESNIIENINYKTKLNKAQFPTSQPIVGTYSDKSGQCRRNSLQNFASNIDEFIIHRVKKSFQALSQSVVGLAVDSLSATFDKTAYNGKLYLQGNFEYLLPRNTNTLEVSACLKKYGTQVEIENFSKLKKLSATVATDLYGYPIVIKPSYNLSKSESTLFLESAFSSYNYPINAALQVILKRKLDDGSAYDGSIAVRNIFNNGRDMISPSFKVSERLFACEYARKLNTGVIFSCMINSAKKLALIYREEAISGSTWTAIVRVPLDNVLDGSIKFTREITF